MDVDHSTADGATHEEGSLGHAQRLSDAEQRQVLLIGNATATPSPQARCIHQLFEAQVEQTPNAIALVFTGAPEPELTYKELNQRANQLAHYLRDLGVGRRAAGTRAAPGETLVGLYLPRSIESIVGLLAILKAGAAYMPLDPAYPQERLAWMLADAQPQVVLTLRSEAPKLPPHTAQIVALDDTRQTLGGYSTTNPICNITPQQLAYVIYTSGSTGTPKGVLVPHQGLSNLAQAQIRAFDVRSDSRVLQFSSLSFDASIAEIIMTLLAGATLYLAPQEALIPGQALIDLLQSAAISTVTLPPSVLAALPYDRLPALRSLIVAGEACSADVAMRWSANRRFFNAYGPTEITVCATIGEYGRDGQRPPIGRPMSNTRIYLLNRQWQPVPIGASGEIYIGSAGIARGYLNRPDLTAERFIPNPWSGKAAVEPGARLYRTGDLGRYLPDGTIEYLGRLDQQVKVRGFRIELGEIETVLGRHAAVQECVVIAREDTGQKRLVAYVVPEQTTDRSSDDAIELWPSVAEYFVYDDILYGAMTHDERRNSSYRRALDQTARNKVVVDIGTGKDAILARLCVEAGARKVYAIELLEATYQAALAAIRRLGLEDRICLIHGNALDVQLPELADVCVSEIVGAIGGSEGAARIINSARRFLKPDGIMIPQRSITRLAAVSLPDDVLNEPGFSELSAHYVRKIFEQVGYPFDLRLCLKHFPESRLISTTDVLEDLDFTKPVELEYTRQATFTITQDGRMDGLLAWLTLETIAGETIDILKHQHSWIPVYFPIFSPGVQVSAGDTITATIVCALSENGLNPDYRITGQLMRQDRTTVAFDYDALHDRRSFKEKPFYRALFNGDSPKIKPAARKQVSIKALREHLQQRLPDYMIPAAFVLLPSLPLTPNGKLDRQALPAPASSRPHLEVAFVAPGTPVETTLTGIWADLLGLERVGTNDNFFELGGDSILCIQVISRARQAGLHISTRQIFQHPTIAELATVATTARAIHANQQPVIGPVPLTPIQHWFFEKNFPEPQHWNQAMLLEMPAEIKPAIVEQTLRQLMQHHDALRLRFMRTAAGWQQVNAPCDDAVPFTVIDLAALPQAEQAQALQSVAEQIQAGLDLERDPRLAVALFELGPGRTKRLLIVINYLAVDGVSWRILLEDFQQVYQQISQDQAAQLPPKTTSYQYWAQRLVAYAQSEALRGELGYWLAETHSSATPLPLDRSAGANTEASARCIALSLSVEETRHLLHDVPRAYHTQINDVLLTALILAFARWTGGRSLLIDLEGHGREDLFDDVDLSRTVGWFTSYYPVHLHLINEREIGPSLIGVKERLRQIPNRGIGYSLLRYLSADARVRERLRSHPQPALRFNYLGQFDQVVAGSALFRRAKESYGPTRSLKGNRTHLLVVEGIVAEHQLHLEWTYSANLHQAATIERLAARYMQALREIIAHCLAPAAGQYTPSDFPLAALDQQQLNKLAAALECLDENEEGANV